MDLKGKTALVTGGAIRIGKAIATALAHRGVNLALVYNRSEDAAQQLKSELRQLGVKVELYQVDLSDSTAIEPLLDAVKKSLGPLDILINNAGIFPKGKLMDLTQETLNQVFSVNLFAPLFLMRAFAEQLPEETQGKIVNIIDAKVFKSSPERFAYRLTKVALWEATKMAAMELAPRVTVNAVSPGLMMSLAGMEHLDMQSVAERRVPLKMLGSGEIVAHNVIHILEQDFMTGNNIVLDGGEYL